MEQITAGEQKLSREEIESVWHLYHKPRFFIDGMEDSMSCHDAIDYCRQYRRHDECKFGLLPLSSISDEHAIEVAKIFNEHKIKAHYNCEDLHDYLIMKGKFYSICCERYTSVFQYLIRQQYAVPLFFGVNHCANGKTAIELNLAIDRATVTNQ